MRGSEEESGGERERRSGASGEVSGRGVRGVEGIFIPLVDGEVVRRRHAGARPRSVEQGKGESGGPGGCGPACWASWLGWAEA